MFVSKTAVAAVLASLAGANALSGSCTSELALLALTGPISECLQLTSLLPVISGSGSVIPSLNSYLSSICSSSTPRCSSSALQYANGNLTNSCSSDLSGGGNDATEIEALQQLLMHYDNVYDAGCAKNSTENQYCLTSTLYQVQNSTGQQITTSFLTSLLAGSGDGLSQIEQTFSSGRLCTGCVKTIYEQAVDANSSIANSAIAKDLSNTCGSSFIDSSATATGVSAVSTSAAATSGSSSSSSSSSTHGAAASAYNLPSAMPTLVGGMVLTVAAVLGGTMVL